MSKLCVKLDTGKTNDEFAIEVEGAGKELIYMLHVLCDIVAQRTGFARERLLFAMAMTPPVSPNTKVEVDLTKIKREGGQ